MYLSPDSTSSTRRLGSSERRAARTQPAVPAGGCRLRDQGRVKGEGVLASSYDDDVVLGIKRLLARGAVRCDILEVFEEASFLGGAFGGL